MYIIWKFATTTIIQYVVVLLYTIAKMPHAMPLWVYGNISGSCCHN